MNENDVPSTAPVSDHIWWICWKPSDKPNAMPAAEYEGRHEKYAFVSLKVRCLCDVPNNMKRTIKHGEILLHARTFR